jgi:hypothetical protein
MDHKVDTSSLNKSFTTLHKFRNNAIFEVFVHVGHGVASLKAIFMLERAVCETGIVRDTPMFRVIIF